jgi:two-component system OmpR family sensor kinase
MVSLESRLKRRLLLGVLLVSLVLGVTVRNQVHQQQTELLNYQLEQVARALILSDLPGTVQTWDDDPALHLDVQIWDADDQLLYRSSDKVLVKRHTPPGLSSVRSGPQFDAVQVKVFTLSNQQRTVQVMHAQALRDALHLDTEMAVLIPALFIMLVGAILVGVTIRKALKPIRQLDEELGRRDASSLQAVVLDDAPAELLRVVNTLNRLLAQLDDSMQAHKRFISNAAHELRTPITAINLDVNNLLQGQDPAQIQSTTARLKTSVGRAQHLLLQMLTLARLEARTRARPLAPVDLQLLAQASMMGLSALASHRGIEFALQVNGCTVVSADADEIRLLMDNLLGNALKFSPTNSVVEMQLIRADQTLSLLLRDHGPGIAADMRDRVMLPFERANDSVDGAGLGLAIVQEIVSNQRATLSLEAPEEGCGLLVRVVFSVT